MAAALGRLPARAGGLGVLGAPRQPAPRPRPLRAAKMAGEWTARAVTTVPVILGHLDLDAFFAAVEELENPELRSKPLDRGRRSSRTRRRRDRELRGAEVRDPLGDVLRRGAAPLPARGLRPPAQERLPRVLEGGLGAVREVVPTVERTGLDEGYLDLGEVAASFREARRLAEAVQTSVRGATSLTRRDRSRDLQGRGQDRERPPQAGGLTVVPAGREASFLAPFDVRRLPGVGPRCEARLRAAGWRRSARSPSLTDAASASFYRARSASSSATVRAASTRAASRPQTRARLDQPPRRRSSGTSPTASSSRTSCRRMADAPRRAPAQGRARPPAP